MKDKEILALFPGQGSQSVGMGKTFYEASPAAKEHFAIADEVLGFSLSGICFNGPAEKLTLTSIAQPAILTVSTIAFLAFKERYPEAKIVAAAGHSLGEYSALVAAQAISFRDAVLLVHKRGKYMQEAVAPGAGKMVAVLGKDLADIEAALSKVTSGVAEVANANAPGQIVVAGARESVDEFVKHLGGGKVVELQVSAPFHCALMKPAEEKLSKDLLAVNFHNAQFPIYANVDAKPVTEPVQIRDTLIRQVCGRVRWIECMEKAISETSPNIAIEFGEGNVLSGLLKRINPALERKAIRLPEDV